MKVIAYDIVTPADIPEGCQFVGLDDVFRNSDVVILHCPLTPQTEKIVNKQRLALMKKRAFLINAGRGPLVDEQALADAPNNEMITGAGLDVLSSEPPANDNPLLKAKTVSSRPTLPWPRVRLAKDC